MRISPVLGLSGTLHFCAEWDPVYRWGLRRGSTETGLEGQCSGTYPSATVPLANITIGTLTINYENTVPLSKVCRLWTLTYLSRRNILRYSLRTFTRVDESYSCIIREIYVKDKSIFNNKIGNFWLRSNDIKTFFIFISRTFGYYSRMLFVTAPTSKVITFEHS